MANSFGGVVTVSNSVTSVEIEGAAVTGVIPHAPPTDPDITSGLTGGSGSFDLYMMVKERSSWITITAVKSGYHKAKIKSTITWEQLGRDWKGCINWTTIYLFPVA